MEPERYGYARVETVARNVTFGATYGAEMPVTATHTVTGAIGMHLSEVERLVAKVEGNVTHILGSVPAQGASSDSRIGVAPNGLLDEWDKRLSSLVARLAELDTRLTSTTGFPGD